jgi:histone H3/H4
MNTSESVLTVLSEHLRQLSVQALRQAAADGRKTVMDRDYETALRLFKGK